MMKRFFILCLSAIAFAILSPAIVVQAQTENCIDGRDNDNNGKIDCDDQACKGRSICLTNVEVCTVKGDEDSDGRADCDDSDCAKTHLCLPDVENCQSGKDEDGDGKIDCDDSDCQGLWMCETRVENCTNGLDDSGDGTIDCEDPQCRGTAFCSLCPVASPQTPASDLSKFLSTAEETVSVNVKINLPPAAKSAKYIALDCKVSLDRKVISSGQLQQKLTTISRGKTDVIVRGKYLVPFDINHRYLGPDDIDKMTYSCAATACPSETGCAVDATSAEFVKFKLNGKVK